MYAHPAQAHCGRHNGAQDMLREQAELRQQLAAAEAQLKAALQEEAGRVAELEEVSG